MKIRRVDLADFGNPERIVTELFKIELDLPTPIPVEELARQLDIIDITPLKTEAFEGALVTTRAKLEGVILVNERSRPGRRRFTIGHELGHFLIPAHIPPDGGFFCSADDLSKASADHRDRVAQMEVEANRFAALLLMPTERFRSDLRRRPSADLEHVVELAGKYGTSKEAAARRYVELHSEVCAVVLSHKDRFLRARWSKTFPYLGFQRGASLPVGSLSTSFTGSLGTISGCEEIDPAIWLSDRNSRDTGQLFEQVLVQGEGYRLTLLLHEPVEMTDGDDS